MAKNFPPGCPRSGSPALLQSVESNLVLAAHRKTPIVNKCFLVNIEEFVEGDERRGCVVAIDIERRFADWACECPRKQLLGFHGCFVFFFD